MDTERSCDNCKYIDMGINEEPCNKCVRNYIDQWKPIEYKPRELALRFIERLENDTNRRQWCADMKESGKCKTECIDCIMTAVKKLLES
jgi:hypothetical protein